MFNHFALRLQHFGVFHVLRPFHQLITPSRVLVRVIGGDLPAQNTEELFHHFVYITPDDKVGLFVMLGGLQVDDDKLAFALWKITGMT